MIKCSKCGLMNDTQNSFCSDCGALIGRLKTSKKNNAVLIIVLSALGIVVTGVLVYFYFFPLPITVPGRYASIQDAINAAKDGRIIIVKPGVYYENINFFGKSIILKSTDPDNIEIVEGTIIDGSNNGTTISFINNEPEQTILQGFTITGGSGTLLTLSIEENGTVEGIESFYGGGILILNGSSPTISKNIIRNNVNELINGKSYGGGIVAWNSFPFIADNEVRENKATHGGGIYIGGNSSVTLERNFINNNMAVYGGGIHIDLRSEATINDNIIQKNSAVSYEEFMK